MQRTHSACVRLLTILLTLSGLSACRSSGTSPQTLSTENTTPLARRYVLGEVTRYKMTGINQGRQNALHYTAWGESHVVLDELGRHVEEFRWTRLESAGRDVPLDEHSTNFRQRLSLDPLVDMTPPAIGGINPLLIGPVFDLMTFYVDLHPSLHQGQLTKAGDRIRVPHAQPNSWADGHNVLVGEDCIDFELTLQDVAPANAKLRIQHLPPQHACLKFPAAWMEERIVPEIPNNWMQVQRDNTVTPPRFLAATGHEVFDVTIEVARPNGQIVVATMDNTVDVVQRQCRDQSLAECGDSTTFRIRRQIKLERLP